MAGEENKKGVPLLTKAVAGMCGLMLGMELAGYAIFEQCFSEKYFANYPSIAIFFAILGSIILAFVISRFQKEPYGFARDYMITRSISIFSIVIFAGASVYAMDANKGPFLITFACFMIAYLVYESIVLLRLK